jgi:hypothetical protein
LRFRLPSLEPLPPASLEGNVTWGPARVGKHLLLATDQDQLVCVGGDGAPRWKAPLAHGPLAGWPCEVDGAILCASTGGFVWKVDPETGAENASIDLQVPLASGPVLDGKRLLVAARDGALLAISPP